MRNSPLLNRKFFNSFDITVNILFLALIFFLPFTKISVPALGAYEMTLGDLIMFFLAALFIIVRHPIHKKYRFFLVSMLIFIVLVHISIISTIDYFKFILSSIPHFFALALVYVVLCFFSTKGFIYKIKAFRNTMIFSLLLSSLPVYYQLLTGVKNNLFYDAFGWRYSFLAQNPNQYGVYFILFLIMITIITSKYFRKELFTVFLFELLFIGPALFSGSRTATLVFILNVIVVLSLLFYYASIPKKILYSISFSVLVLILTPVVVSVFSFEDGRVSRSLNIFDKLSSDKRFDIGGQTGASIDEGWEVFYSYPFFGIGLGNKTAIVGEHEIHNTYLKYLAESGIVGFLGFLLIFLLPIFTTLGSRINRGLMFASILFYILFGLMNVPHMLYRQRWVWLFITFLIIIAYWNKDGVSSKNKFSFLN